MRPADHPCRSSALAAAAVAAASMTLFAVILVTASAPPAYAAAAPLTVSVDRHLSLVDEAVRLTMAGQLPESPVEAELLIQVRGPAEPAQVGEGYPELPTAATISRALGTASAAGALDIDAILRGGTPAVPGAYLVTVELKSGGVVAARGQVWLGKAAPRETPVDIAFVWPAVLGIHRDPNGVFFDDVLEQAVAPVGESSDSLRGLLDLAGQFPEWQFTLAVEPVLLAQLRDMADGYTQTDASGNRVDVSRDDPAAQSAGRVLAAFKDLAAAESVEIAASPFAGPDLGALAAEGWRDGFEQIQLGKQELQQTLSLATPPTGAFAPDPDLTTAGLSYYGQASIDHVLVDAGLAGLLTEEMREGTVAVRIRDRENDRVTLVFATGRMRTLMAAPWDTGVFCAGLAAELASGSRDALVVTPGVDFALVPAAYLNAIGEELERSSWLRPQTLTALLRSHSPGTRPVLLSEKVTPPPGYIEATLLEGLRAAHVAVTDLAAVADAARAPVETAYRLLYVAESRWWSRARTSPQEASIGLAYAEQARALAQGELDKVSFSNRRSTTIFGHEGVVKLTVENGADYPLTVELRLSGTGLAFPEGKDLEVELAPGRTEIAVRAVGAEDRQTLEALLIAGTTPLDARSQSLRFLTVTAMIPWAVLAVAVIAAASCAVFIWRRRKRAAAA